MPYITCCFPHTTSHLQVSPVVEEVPQVVVPQPYALLDQVCLVAVQLALQPLLLLSSCQVNRLQQLPAMSRPLCSCSNIQKRRAANAKPAASSEDSSSCLHD
jgi:hypothetical protein